MVNRPWATKPRYPPIELGDENVLQVGADCVAGQRARVISSGAGPCFAPDEPPHAGEVENTDPEPIEETRSTCRAGATGRPRRHSRHQSLRAGLRAGQAESDRGHRDTERQESRRKALRPQPVSRVPSLSTALRTPLAIRDCKRLKPVLLRPVRWPTTRPGASPLRGLPSAPADRPDRSGRRRRASRRSRARGSAGAHCRRLAAGLRVRICRSHGSPAPAKPPFVGGGVARAVIDIKTISNWRTAPRQSRRRAAQCCRPRCALALQNCEIALPVALRRTKASKAQPDQVQPGEIPGFLRKLHAALP